VLPSAACQHLVSLESCSSCTHSCVGAKCVHSWQTVKAYISCTCQMRKRVVRSSACRDICRHVSCGICLSRSCTGRPSALIAWLLSLIAFRALYHMYGISILDLVACKGIWILEHTTRVYQTLPGGWKVCVLRGGKFILEIADSHRRWYSNHIFGIARRLDSERELDFGVVVCHGGRLEMNRKRSEIRTSYNRQVMPTESWWEAADLRSWQVKCSWCDLRLQTDDEQKNTISLQFR